MESMEKEFLDLVDKKVAEYKAVKQQKIQKTRFVVLIIELLVQIIGYGLIIYHFNIWLALGIWFATWGNNMMLTRNIHREKGNFWKEIWKDR